MVKVSNSHHVTRNGVVKRNPTAEKNLALTAEKHGYKQLDKESGGFKYTITKKGPHMYDVTAYSPNDGGPTTHHLVEVIGDNVMLRKVWLSDDRNDYTTPNQNFKKWSKKNLNY